MKYFILLLVSCFTIQAYSQTIYPTGLKVGDKAPMFSGTDNMGKQYKLKKMLKQGDVVLVFYRGQWCPYCNKELSQLNDSLSFITAKGATVVAVSPEVQENILKTVEKSKASYPVLSDSAMLIMDAYAVKFQVDTATQVKYKKYGIDFQQANGSNGANLPVPATYIIGKDGRIKYAFFNPDYKLRSSVKDLLEHL